MKNIANFLKKQPDKIDVILLIFLTSILLFQGFLFEQYDKTVTPVRVDSFVTFFRYKTILRQEYSFVAGHPLRDDNRDLILKGIRDIVATDRYLRIKEDMKEISNESIRIFNEGEKEVLSKEITNKLAAIKWLDVVMGHTDLEFLKSNSSFNLSETFLYLKYSFSTFLLGFFLATLIFRGKMKRREIRKDTDEQTNTNLTKFIGSTPL